MSDELYGYYERELIYIRQFSQEFARQYPAAAGRLLLEPNRSVDPHVERLLEGFALLAGRIHQKLDDEFPELTEATLGVLYPHYLAPIPSMAIVQFELDHERGQFLDGFTVERGSKLRSIPIADVACKFRTGYPVVLWPIEVAQAKVLTHPLPPGLPDPPPNTAAVLRIRLESQGGLGFSDFTSLDRLRFYLAGDSSMIATLYETIFTKTLRVVLQSPKGGESIVLEPSECLAQVGFGRDEGILPYPDQSFLGYRLLTEFFSFPSKFLFMDLLGIDGLKGAGFGAELDILLYLSKTTSSIEQGVAASTFRLGCTPIVNLFEQTAEPISLTQTRYEYRVIPDVATPQGMEVYSIDSVVGTDPVARASFEYLPFYSFRHGTSRETNRAFWQSSRRPSVREEDRGTEVYLRLVDLDFHPRLPAESTVVVRTTCTNRDLPARLHHAGDRLWFSPESAAPIHPKIRCVRLPTAPVRLPSRRGLHWRLISHLCLNHLSLSDGKLGRQSLQELLRLYDVSDPGSDETSATVNRQAIEGILSVSSRRVVGWIDAPEASGFCRGVEVTIEFDEKKYVGIGAFLFASVLERFLGLYVSINSFCRLVARAQSTEEQIKTWPPRAGEQTIL